MEKDDLVTLNELFDIIKPYCEKKIQRDLHKEDPLKFSRDKLMDLLYGEYEELCRLNDDEVLYERVASNEEYLNEIADCINYLLFIVGKVKNYKIFLRG